MVNLRRSKILQLLEPATGVWPLFFGESKMRYFKILLLTISLASLLILNVHADRLYTWIDDQGVTHISQNPPPPNAVIKDTMDYRSQPDEQNQAGRAQKKRPKKAEPDKKSTGSGEGLEPEMYSEEDSDTENYRREAKKKKEIKDGRNGKDDDKSDETSENEKREHRSHKSKR